MAVDHFIRNKNIIAGKDWNFNILFNDQPQVAELASKFAKLLDHPGLYKPIPTQWLHATVLRVGFVNDFSEAEMLEVARRLEPRLAEHNMPLMMLGQWWLWKGGPVLHMMPDQHLNEMHDELIKSLDEVTGLSRLPAKLQFVPHVTLAYPKNNNDELSIYRQLQANSADGVEIRVKNLSLIKQHVVNDHYEWEVIKEIPIGQA